MNWTEKMLTIGVGFSNELESLCDFVNGLIQLK